MLFARQPRWRTIPSNGGLPLTFPESFTLSASKPSSSFTFAPSSSSRTAVNVTCARSALRSPFVHCARRGADVRVAERRHVLLEEVDEAPIALQERQELKRRVRARRGRELLLLRRGGRQ